MDAKELAVITQLHTLIKERRFNERDALAFLILLRRHAPVGGVVRELGDFVAHRERDRGLMKRVLEQLQVFITGTGERTLRVEPMLTASSLLSPLNEVLSENGLSLFSVSDAEDLLLATMALLHDVQLVTEKAPLGRLILARSHAEVMLVGAVKIDDGAVRPVEAAVPVAVVPRPSPDLPADGTPAAFAGIVEARCVNRVLGLFIGHAKAG